MGANASTSANGGNRQSGAPSDHYQVLGIEQSASSLEIKKAFRSLALREHPDKNPNDIEGATLRFSRIQAAYEVLSDEQERAWYDDHQEEILNPSSSSNNSTSEADYSYFEEVRRGKRKPRDEKPKEGKRPDRGLQSQHLMKFFSNAAWTAFDDTPTGFYTTYRTLFSLLSADETSWSSPHLYPSFGSSSTPSLVDLRSFYQTWLNFQTEKDFAWKDMHRIEEGMPRYVRREIEKENLRSRQQAKRDYNETVRNLVLFVRRRDPRYESTSTPSAMAQATAEIKATLAAASKQRAIEREASAKAYKEGLQDWETGEKGLESVLKEWEEGSELDDNSEEEGEEEDERVWCEACMRGYRSGGAWEDHERSRKHMKNVDRLIKEMQAQDAELGLDTVEPPPPLPTTKEEDDLQAQLDIDLATLSVHSSDSEQDEADLLPTKKSKKDKKKSRKVLSSLPVSDEEDVEEEEVPEEEEEEVVGMAQSKKKGKKGKGKKKALPPTGLELEVPEGLDRASLGRVETDNEEEDFGRGKKGKKGRRAKGLKSGTATPASEVAKDDVVEEVGTGAANDQAKEEELEVDEMSKKDKRRLKNAVKKDGAAAVISCNVCSEGFASRSKLFKHIEETGHALAEGASGGGGGGGKGKKKGGKR